MSLLDLTIQSYRALERRRSLLTSQAQDHAMTLADMFQRFSLRGVIMSGYTYTFGIFLFTFLALWLYLRGHKSSRPGEPPMLPYQFPIIGHTLEFIHNSEALITRGRLHFDGTATTFSVSIAGRPLYVLTDPDDLSFVHRRPELFTARSPILEFILVSLGMSKSGAHALMFSEDKHDKSIFETVHDIQARHLSGIRFHALVQQFGQVLNTRLAPEAICLSRPPQASGQWLGLNRWAREAQVLVFQEIFFGPALGEMDRDIHKNLLEYSRLVWQAWYHVPPFLRKANSCGSRIQSTFKKWLKLRPEERRASTSIESLVQRLRASSLSDSDISVFLLFSYWGICMNVSNMTFWLLAHIISNPELMSTIREETAPAFEDEAVDTEYLLNQSPHFNSVWHECLRLYTSVTTSRYVTQDTQLGPTILRKGHVVLFSARQIAFHDKRFGGNPLQFDPMRFLNTPELITANSHKPFGGGRFVCLGRHLTRYIHAAFVAIMLRNFDVRMNFPQKFPQPLENEPAIGVLSSADELFVEITERR